MGIARGHGDSLTHTSDSEDECQLVVQPMEEISLRRTTVGKSERQLPSLIIDVQEGSSRPPPSVTYIGSIPIIVCVGSASILAKYPPPSVNPAKVEGILVRVDHSFLDRLALR
jgi:hypothetical protein